MMRAIVPIVVILVGIVTAVNDVQYWKALAAILVQCDGIVTDDDDGQFNQEANDFTDDGIVSDGIEVL